MDRRNRIRFALLGLLLLAAGVAGLLTGADVVEAPAAGSPILPDWLVARWDRYNPWNLVAVAIAALLVAWYGWRLVRAQLRRGGAGLEIGRAHV